MEERPGCVYVKREMVLTLSNLIDLCVDLVDCNLDARGIMAEMGKAYYIQLQP